MSTPYDFMRRRNGGRESASVKPDPKLPERVIHDQETKDEGGTGVLSGQPMGTVGLSMTVGMSTNFSREKVEVTVWETRPVSTDPADRDRVRQDIAQDLLREASGRLEAVIGQFFPEMLDVRDQEQKKGGT